MPKTATAEERIAWHHAHQEHCACRPIPRTLVEQIESSRGPRATRHHRAAGSLRKLLSGADRRSIAGSERARALVRRTPARISEVAALAKDKDGDLLVSMGALDLLEKLAHERPDWVQPHKRLFIGPLADSDRWEVRLQVVRALPFLKWTPRERKRVIEILTRDVEHPQKFVRAWALDSLATLGRGDSERSGSKALETRARHIRDRLDRGDPA
jgi:hypothetical protein